VQSLADYNHRDLFLYHGPVGPYIAGTMQCDTNADGRVDLILNGPGVCPTAMIVDPTVNATFGETIAIDGDLDGDGYSDLVSYNGVPSRIYVYRGSSAGVAKVVPQIFTDTGYSFSGARFIGDANRDGYDDLLVPVTSFVGSTQVQQLAVYYGGVGGLTSGAKSFVP
jgi:hypothetical protein